MLYFDTSFLVPMLIAEETSDKVEAFLLALSPEQDLTVSHWTRVEFARCVGAPCAYAATRQARCW